MIFKNAIHLIIYAQLILLSFNSYSQVNLTNGLVANYPFNGNANDVSGNGHNGQLQNGVQLTDDRYGNALSAYHFDGIDDYISVPDDGSFSTPLFSLAFWFKTESNSLQNLMGKRDYATSNGTGGAQYQFFINHSVFPGMTSNLVGNDNACSNVTSSSYVSTNEWACVNKWYFIVVTFDGSFHKIYVNGVLKRNVATSFNGILPCNSELRFGNWWALDLITFKGTLDDIRWYNRPLNQNEVNALFNNFSTASGADFTFSQDICNPLRVQFKNITEGATISDWDFGFTTASGINSIITFPKYGPYQAKLKSQDSFGCPDSAVKMLTIDLSPGNVILNNDTSICAGSNFQLFTDSGVGYCWRPDPSINNPNIANSLITPDTSNTYYFNSKKSSLPDLINNGDFSGGNIGFINDYSFVNNNTGSGQYGINANAQLWNPTFPNCPDHSNLAGKMLLVHSNGIQGSVIWKQNINVLPNTNYEISYWMQSFNAINPAEINMLIDGNIATSSIAPINSCNWKKNSVFWNSGIKTSIGLSLTNNNPISGSTFAIDDIRFSQVNMYKDSVRINTIALPIIRTGNDTSICKGQSVQLTSSGGTSFYWSPAIGLSDASIPNPLSTPIVSTQYIVTGILNGCAAKDSISINILPTPTVSIGNDTSICLRDSIKMTTNVTNTNNFSWSPTAGLSNASIADPVATPLNTTTYKLTALNIDGCSGKDSINVIVLPLPFVTTSNDTSICTGQAVQIITNSSEPVSYNWTPSLGLSNASISNPIAMPLVNVQYIVKGTNTAGCSGKDTIRISVHPVNTFSISPSFINACGSQNILITANGGDSYLWYTKNINNISSSNVLTGTATVSDTFYVVLSDNICKVKDTLSSIVKVNPKPITSISKSNDVNCIIQQALLVATGGVKYQWSPSVNINNPNIANPLVYPVTNTWYYVQMTDANNCTATDSILVQSMVGGGIGNFYIPNAFTPNSDGKNDCFGVKYWGIAELFEFSIYNRWGQKIFDTKNLHDCWDGTFKGKAQSAGVYVYQIKVKSACSNGVVFKKGQVILIR